MRPNSLRKAAAATRRIRCPSLLRAQNLFRLSPASLKLKDARSLACVGRRWKRWRHRETPRSSVSSRQPRRHAKDKALPKRGLRHRRLSLRGKTFKQVGRSSDRFFSDSTMPTACSITWDFRRVSKPRTSRPSPTSSRPIKQDRSFTGNAPGGPSRWSTKRSSEWQPVKPKYVVEVSYDHFTGGRFRHGTSILRWRPDKKPAQCTFEQVQQKIDRTLLSKLKIK